MASSTSTCDFSPIPNKDAIHLITHFRLLLKNTFLMQDGCRTKCYHGLKSSGLPPFWPGLVPPLPAPSAVSVRADFFSVRVRWLTGDRGCLGLPSGCGHVTDGGSDVPVGAGAGQSPAGRVEVWAGRVFVVGNACDGVSELR